ncbi:ComEC/Rec2 family competence protein [Chryseobacterium indoltheticum]|uniref:ComEC/Rec2 family competence protein n=1 Tax=Chryseobacterium indoltheticum TaxID=254 RepID=UPI003F49478E
MHFLAISGTHIVVIFGMFYFLMMRFSSVRLKKICHRNAVYYSSGFLQSLSDLEILLCDLVL